MNTVLGYTINRRHTIFYYFEYDHVEKTPIAHLISLYGNKTATRVNTDADIVLKLL